MLGEVRQLTPPSRAEIELPAVAPGSLGIVEDDAERVALAGADPADTVAHGDAIHTTRSLYRPMMDREHHAVSLTEWHHLGARLPARSLLGEHELAPERRMATCSGKTCSP
jgi:hypothetical protein